MKVHLVAPLAVTMMLCAGISIAKADTEFDYVGNNFSYCFDVNLGLNSSCYGGRVTGDFVTTLSGSTLDDLNNVFLTTGDVVDFTFTDGLELVLTPTNTNLSIFQLATDDLGNLTSWNVFAVAQDGVISQQNDIEILSAPSGGLGEDLSHHCVIEHPPCTEDRGFSVAFPQGVWSEHSVNVPEPGSLSLFGASLVSAYAMRRRKIKRV